MAQGTLKWFSDKKGFGFITPNDGSKDLFVHHSEIQVAGTARRTLADGQSVEFTPMDDPKGLKATKVFPK